MTDHHVNREKSRGRIFIYQCSVLITIPMHSRDVSSTQDKKMYRLGGKRKVSFFSCLLTSFLFTHSSQLWSDFAGGGGENE